MTRPPLAGETAASAPGSASDGGRPPAPSSPPGARALSARERDAVERAARRIVRLDADRRADDGEHWTTRADEPTPLEIVERACPFDDDRRRWRLLLELALERADDVRS